MSDLIVQFPDGKRVNLKKGIDLSIPLTNDTNNPRAWYVDVPKFEPVMENGWIGSVRDGGSVNFRNIFFNPHGHGTHTECLGHITPEVHSINQHIDSFFARAFLISVTPIQEETENGLDDIITNECFKNMPACSKIEALIIRTVPNDENKRVRNYSATNPPYLHLSCLKLFNKLGIKHLLIDLPSVDREQDGGKLAFHHAFWGVPENPIKERTITEFVFVPNHVQDGEYLLNLQVAPFENDASPSRPVIFAFE